MPKLTATVGMPGCGKTTWAKAQVTTSNGQVKRLNKDDLRALLDAGIWSKENEALVLQTRDLLISTYLQQGFDVIVDDTHLEGKHLHTLLALAEANNVDFHVQNFNQVPLATCWQRNMARPIGTRVPDYAMKRMAKAAGYTQEEIAKVVLEAPKPTAYIFDIDSTLCEIDVSLPKPRHWHEYDRVGEDVILHDVLAVANTLCAAGHNIVVVTGREAACSPQTIALLEQHIPLALRPSWSWVFSYDNDRRQDVIKKRELYERLVYPKYNVLGVFDDRSRVVEMWRDLGLRCYQVCKGDY